MVSFPTQGLGEKIVESLYRGSMKTSDLIAFLSKGDDGPTLQGIYKSLRLLRKQQIVILHNRVAMLNSAWLAELQRFALLAEHSSPRPASDSGHFLQMRDGDRITYEFKNPIQVDIFWNHVLYILFDALPGQDRWYAYASHCWFLLARRTEELSLRDHMNKRGIRYLFTVGHKTSVDRSVIRDFDGLMSQCYMLNTPLFRERANHLGIVLNVFGDYVVEAHYDERVTGQIESFYKRTSNLTQEKAKELEQIVSQRSRIKFVIFKNTAKAKRLSKMFEKFFYFGKGNNKALISRPSSPRSGGAPKIKGRSNVDSGNRI